MLHRRLQRLRRATAATSVDNTQSAASSKQINLFTDKLLKCVGNCIDEKCPYLPTQAMSTTSVKVAVRVRPMAAKELLANSSDCVDILPGTQQLVVGGGPASGVGTDTFYSFSSKSFTFDYLFDTESTQVSLYETSVSPLVERFLEGFNATVLAYGQVLKFDTDRLWENVLYGNWTGKHQH